MRYYFESPFPPSHRSPSYNLRAFTAANEMKWFSCRRIRYDDKYPISRVIRSNNHWLAYRLSVASVVAEGIIRYKSLRQEGLSRTNISFFPRVIWFSSNILLFGWRIWEYSISSLVMCRSRRAPSTYHASTFVFFPHWFHIEIGIAANAWIMHVACQSTSCIPHWNHSERGRYIKLICFFYRLLLTRCAVPEPEAI